MLSTIILITGIYIVFGLFEINFSAEKSQSIKGRLRNIGYTALFLMLGEAVLLSVYAFLPINVRNLPEYGIWFSLFILILYVFLVDFIFYWYHRAEHYFEILWPIHELHHSDTELNVTTSMRTYWLERPLQTLLIIISLNYVIGIDTLAAIALPFVLTVWLFFTHANIKLRLGIFTPVITGPQLHRIHHSNLPQHYKKNFAQFFPIIDILFGTYYRPQYDEFPTTGITGVPSDMPIYQTMIRPFRLWNNLLNRNKPPSAPKA
jgi:sterol desaturase/sphingolipid hydroxylase (fatty acid hydroxylase superfamily)